MNKALDHLKRTVGSLLIVGFEGPHLTGSCLNYLSQWDLGGVILFKRNIESFEQVLELNQHILHHAEVPPIISVDHEGGRVFRMPEPFTQFPPMGQLIQQYEFSEAMNLAKQIGIAFGRELRAAGFNVDYAPVLDVHSNPQNPIIGDRAFSILPEQVPALAMAFAKGLHSQEVLSCGKHFPGHGDTSEDSHLTLPTVDKTEADLRQCELVPFQQAIRQTIPMLMTAHVMYPAWDQEWPATLSEKIIHGLLREELQYRGIIVSDDLFMKGIAETWPLEEAAERFFRCGGDMILLCHQESVQRRVSAHLVHQAEKDLEFKKLLELKSQRVNRFRKLLVQEAQPQWMKQYAGEHQALVEKLQTQIT